MRKLYIVLSLLVLASMLITACGSKAPTQEQIAEANINPTLCQQAGLDAQIILRIESYATTSSIVGEVACTSVLAAGEKVDKLLGMFTLLYDPKYDDDILDFGVSEATESVDVLWVDGEFSSQIPYPMDQINRLVPKWDDGNRTMTMEQQPGGIFIISLPK